MDFNFVQNLVFFSPFEQFDSVTWILVDSLWESKVHFNEYIFYSTSPEISALTSQGKVTNLQFYLVLFYAFVGFVILSSTYTEVFSVNKIIQANKTGTTAATPGAGLVILGDSGVNVGSLVLSTTNSTSDTWSLTSYTKQPILSLIHISEPTRPY